MNEQVVIKLLKILKEYLPLILLVPVILGGLWQILELGSMSMSYIRFFSATQLIADGLLMILVFLPWLLNFIVFKEIFSAIIKHKEENVKTSISYVVGIIALVIIGLCIVYFIVFLIPGNTIIDYFIHVCLISLLIFSLAIMGFWGLVFNFFKHTLHKKNTIKFIIIFSILFIFITFFHNKFHIPNNLENRLNLDNLPINNGDIRYYNDKYIFIEHKKDNNNTTIQVVLFEKLFDDNNTEKKTKGVK